MMELHSALLLIEDYVSSADLITRCQIVMCLNNLIGDGDSIGFMESSQVAL